MNLSKTSSSNDVTASTNCDVISATTTPEVAPTNQNEAGSEVQNEATSPPTSPGRRISRAYLPPVPAFLKNMPAVSCFGAIRMNYFFLSRLLKYFLRNCDVISIYYISGCVLWRSDSRLYLYRTCSRSLHIKNRAMATFVTIYHPSGRVHRCRGRYV